MEIQGSKHGVICQRNRRLCYLWRKNPRRLCLLRYRNPGCLCYRHDVMGHDVMGHTHCHDVMGHTINGNASANHIARNGHANVTNSCRKIKKGAWRTSSPLYRTLVLRTSGPKKGGPDGHRRLCIGPWSYGPAVLKKGGAWAVLKNKKNRTCTNETNSLSAFYRKAKNVKNRTYTNEKNSLSAFYRKAKNRTCTNETNSLSAFYRKAKNVKIWINVRKRLKVIRKRPL